MYCCCSPTGKTKYLITDISYPDDALLPKLGSFDGTQSRKVNIIGTAYAALPALGTDGQPVVTVIHAYIADTDDDICIISANQIAKAGGSLMYGTCQKTTIEQVVQTTQGLRTTTHTFTGNVSMLMSPSGGAVPLHEIDDFYYAHLLTGVTRAGLTHTAVGRHRHFRRNSIKERLLVPRISPAINPQL